MNEHVKYELSIEQSKRIDILKLLFALFVVYIHAGVSDINFSTGAVETVLPKWFTYYSYILSDVLPRCAVPGFFFISSLLLYRKEFGWKDNIKKRLKTILIPYVIMNTFWIVAFAIGQFIPQTQMFFADKNNIVADFNAVRWIQAYGIGAEYPFLYPLWFLRNIFILNLLATAIKKIIDFKPRASFLVVCIIFLFVSKFPFNNFWHLLAPLDLCMWCFGYFFVKNQWNLEKCDNRKVLIPLFLLSCGYRIFTMNIAISWVGPYRICIIIALLFWYVCFTKNVNGRIQKLFLKLFSYNFGIYIFHERILSFGKK